MPATHPLSPHTETTAFAADRITDEKFMRRCLQLAALGRQESRPNPMVGAVIVVPAVTANGGHDWRIIGEGYHVRCGEGHAEVNAFASVSPEDEPLLHKATIYVSLEPCAHYGKTPPCCDLIVSKGVRRVVVGCVDSFAKVQGRGIQRIREAGISVTVGVLEDECRWLNRRFFTFHNAHRPYIILKWAQMHDRTGLPVIDNNGQAAAISTPFTQMLVHRLRAEEDAILVGRTTYEREHPLLNVRKWSGKSPAKMVLTSSQRDGNASMKPSVFEENEVFAGNIDEVLQECRRRSWQSLVVEGGRQTLQSFLDRGLWDELRIETSPQCVEGGTPAPAIPTDAEEFGRETWEGHEIVHLRRKRVGGKACPLDTAHLNLPSLISYLSDYPHGESRAMVLMLLEDRFHLSTCDVLTGGIEQLSDTDKDLLVHFMTRLKAGEPLQYVLGTAQFLGRSYRVAPGVLIPRPETAALCEWMEENEKRRVDGCDVLDIGTGSGCIACTLAKRLQKAHVTAWDLSSSALDMARENALSNLCDIDFQQQDALSPPDDSEKWDLIVSNPPYVCRREMADMDTNVLDWEPHMALFVPDDDPLRFYRSIAHYAKDALKKGGVLYFEINPLYAEPLCRMLTDFGFSDVEVKKDPYDKQRFVRGCRKN